MSCEKYLLDNLGKFMKAEEIPCNFMEFTEAVAKHKMTVKKSSDEIWTNLNMVKVVTVGIRVTKS